MSRYLLIFVFVLFFPLTVTFAQETYRCNVGGSLVYQDRPCPGSERRSSSMPTKSAPASVASSSDQPSAVQDGGGKSKLDQDKEYINQRVKARVFDREKNSAAEQIQHCDASVQSIEYEINQVADGYQRGTPVDAASAHALQLDAQRRQTKVAALQSQATSRRSDCDRMRAEFDRTYRK